MFKRILMLAAIAAFVGMQGVAVAGDYEKAEKEEHAEHVQMEGTLVCLGCTLKGEGARSECSEYGHTHALLVEDDELVLFLPNKYSVGLMEGGELHSKMVAVSGIYYEDANILDVEIYEVDGQKYGWCDHCSAMDGCAFAKK
jgi:hypothetical protein